MAHVLAVLPLLGMPGIGEWLIILAVVVFFFGAAKLPLLGKSLGEGIRNFKKGIRGEDPENSELPTKPDNSSSDGNPPKNEG
ncbi:MAG: twin-arginine translocase TatA/TatE family subunit [Myxococcota bacterium]|jgi:sec-independent protein translocase protein TatA|nr:twin-arginine translocase TatA/TatE family subunit [Myxococcota bacterium]